MADVVYINVEEGLKRMMDNSKLYARLLGKFKEDKNLQLTEEAIAAGDMEKAQNAAHTLKGTAGNLSLTELYNQTVELESQIKARDVDPQQIAKVKDVLAQTITEVNKVIEQYA
jgi:HPt (histidine-containing phosphotransfer) domain-containing protein